jgi:hypothetical protein
MAIQMGPVLSFRGCDDGNWNLTAIVAAKNNPGTLAVSGQLIDPEVLLEHSKGTVYRFTFNIPMEATQTETSYQVDGQTYEICVPGTKQAPTMAYASCNGFSSLKLMKGIKDKNYLWNVMARKHGLPKLPGAPADDENTPEVKSPTPYHLLLQGGDQVYADAMWETVPAMKTWNEHSWEKGNKTPLTAKVQQALDDFYFDLYTSRWSQPEVARILARVPSIAMWDDHDLIDGWGSYPQERQNCEVFGGIWKSASKAFAVFQQHLKDGERRPGTIGNASASWWQQTLHQDARQGAFSFGYTVGKVTILAVDMRSQRTSQTQVVRQEHWDEIYSWIDALKSESVTHLIVMSSIPVVYPGFDTLETLLGIFPGHQDLEDDLRDHWDSQPHKGERLRMIHNLLKVPKSNIRATLISGDVHVAALGVIESVREQTPASTEKIINQLISSGIVHPGPGAVVLFALQHLFDSADEIDRGIVGRMIQFPGNQAKFLGGRNYLSLEPDKDERIWCNWLVEKQRFPFTKVIHPIPKA